MAGVIQATLVGLAAGVVGTGMGAALATLSGRPSRRMLSLMMGLAGGIMLTVVFMDLVPQALQLGGAINTIFGFVIGVLSLGALDVFAPHLHLPSGECENSRYLRTGTLAAIGIAMHNFPEGLAIGASYAHGTSLGFTMAVIIALHNIPEGMAMAAPMCAADVHRMRVAFIGGLAGVPMGIGALFGAAFGSVSPGILSVCLGFAGGAMVFITADELIPEAQRFAIGHSGTLGLVLGIILGMLVVL